MILESIIRSRHFERIGVSVTGLRSLSTFAIGFLFTGIISPAFQMVGRSWMVADNWKVKWMICKRL